MTRHDIEHLAQVSLSVASQIRASEKQCMTMDDFDGFLGRMLWAIHASKDNPRFDEGKFRSYARGESESDSRSIFHHE